MELLQSFQGMFRGLFCEGLARPRCICVNSAGFVFVTIGAGTPSVAVFKPNGNLLTNLILGYAYPFGITVDEDDFI